MIFASVKSAHPTFGASAINLKVYELAVISVTELACLNGIALN